MCVSVLCTLCSKTKLLRIEIEEKKWGYKRKARKREKNIKQDIHTY